jgi:hypothetical protein
VNRSRRAPLGWGNDAGLVEVEVRCIAAPVLAFAVVTLVVPGAVILVALQHRRQAVEQSAQTFPRLSRDIAIPSRGIWFKEFKQVHCRASFAVLANDAWPHPQNG